MGSCSRLERLQTELQALILRQAPTVESLYGLIRASPSYYQVFLFMKEDILSNLVRRIFHPSVMSDAFAVVVATQSMERQPTRTLLVSFLEKLERRDWEEVLSVKRLPLSTCISLCQLHRNINFFIDDYIAETTAFLDTQPIRSTGPHPATSEEGHSTKDIVHSEEEILPAFDYPLSAAEMARLQRAFCRLEVFGYLFYNDIENNAVFSPEEQSELFLYNFPYWQIEEIT